MRVVVVDYGAGNLHSVNKSFQKAAENIANVNIEVTSDPARVAYADRVVLPGVGAYDACRKGLDAVDGMIEALNAAVISRGVPFIGMCVGMQLLGQAGYEFGVKTQGLGWLSGEVRKLTPSDLALKIPHMGWNNLVETKPHPLLKNIDHDANVYFVHSFAFTNMDAAEIIAECDYGGKFPAIIGRDNIVATQFHPEKSQNVGLALIANFLNWSPA